VWTPIVNILRATITLFPVAYVGLSALTSRKKELLRGLVDMALEDPSAWTSDGPVALVPAVKEALARINACRSDIHVRVRCFQL
jgi:hypothetical protein